ncbi:hypothetical protein TSAR_005705 [Trichomalopsis sarcophagae]|uniref:Uncharacterized protein n=1 Tax=Trichomalopsis sarcophagae TaxID=543379 RepID=A0A232F8F6_9HYME|nr:hypothetical protein TSAR_005705 [Trichomalopsis sarcophagae]
MNRNLHENLNSNFVKKAVKGITCGYTSRVSNYYKRASRRVECGGGRGSTTECLSCKPEDLGSSPGSVTFSLHSSLVTKSAPHLDRRANSNYQTGSDVG